MPGSAVRGGRGADVSVAAELSPGRDVVVAASLSPRGGREGAAPLSPRSAGAAVAIEALLAARFGAGGAPDLACPPGGAGEEDGAVRLRQLFKLKCSGVAQRVAARLAVSPGVVRGLCRVLARREEEEERGVALAPTLAPTVGDSHAELQGGGTVVAEPQGGAGERRRCDTSLDASGDRQKPSPTWLATALNSMRSLCGVKRDSANVEQGPNEDVDVKRSKLSPNVNCRCPAAGRRRSSPQAPTSTELKSEIFSIR